MAPPASFGVARWGAPHCPKPPRPRRGLGTGAQQLLSLGSVPFLHVPSCFARTVPSQRGPTLGPTLGHCWVAARSSGSSRPLVLSQPRLSLSHPKAKDVDLRPSSSPRTRRGWNSGHGHGGCRGLGAFPGSQQQDQSLGRLAASPAGTSCPAQQSVAPKSASPPQQLLRAQWGALLCCHRYVSELTTS